MTNALEHLRSLCGMAVHLILILIFGVGQDWLLPSRGWLRFDYSSTRRPPPDATSMTEVSEARLTALDYTRLMVFSPPRQV